MGLSGGSAPAGNSVVDDQDHNCPDHSDDHAVDVEAGDPRAAERREDEAPHDRSDDTEHDVHDHAFTALVHDLAGDESRDETENNPSEQRHNDLRSWIKSAITMRVMAASGYQASPDLKVRKPLTCISKPEAETEQGAQCSIRCNGCNSIKDCLFEGT